MEIRTGTIEDIIFHNEENGYTIAIMETDTEMFTVVGCIPQCVKGTAYSLTGEFKIHPSYGEQFVFSEYEEKEPEDKESIIAFLASRAIKGIGEKTARAIVDKFGEETLQIMDKNPERLTEVSGIGQKKMEEIAASYEEKREFAKISMYFQKFGIGPDSAFKMYRRYGANVIDIIEENPYRLIEEVYGIGFKKADDIGQKLGIEKDSPFRIKSGIKYGLSYYASEGNTYAPLKEFCERVGNLLAVSIDYINDILVEMAFEGDVKIDKVDGLDVVYLYAFYYAEQSVCKSIGILSTSELKPVNVNTVQLIEATEKETGIELSQIQKDAVNNSLTKGISVITGGPGTGKTTIINTIINIFKFADFKVAIAAPTGRAAKRITETSGYYASTIHRLLKYYYSESEDSMKFGQNAEDPLKYDVIIVDEASMIDLMLMKGLLDAIKPGTRLILVGDADQLPSIGAGNVLRDLIDSEFVQVSVLKEIFRQAGESMIVVNAHRINKGEYPSVNDRDTDFFFMRRDTEKQIADLIVELITKRLPGFYENLSGSKDIQVLTPVKKGPVGCNELNRLLQENLNPPSEDLAEKKHMGRIFREKDKVMQIKNNYEITWTKGDDLSEGQGIFNGDIGYIDRIDKEYNQLTVIFDENKYVTYEFSELDELELAYAMTVHRSQGSEFPIVVMPVFRFPPILATRNLLYTAVTRGKQAVVLVGDRDKMNGMVDNNRIKLRYSGLKYRLKALMDELL